MKDPHKVSDSNTVIYIKIIKRKDLIVSLN